MEEFNWKRSVEVYGERLAGVAAELICMAGIQLGRKVETLPRHLYLRILSILRPAEYAARRIIIMAACKFDWKLPAPRATLPPCGGDVPQGQSGVGQARGTDTPSAGEEEEVSFLAPSRPLPFNIFDTHKRYPHPFLTEEQVAALNQPKTGPSFVPPPRPADEPIPALRLCRRIRALANAIQNIEHHALRLARWKVRKTLSFRDKERKTKVRPLRWDPFRFGRPPGYKKNPQTAIEEIIKDTHILARDAWNTS